MIPSVGLAQPPQAGNAAAAAPDVDNPPADAVKTESGLATKVLNAGSGAAKPSAEDIVRLVFVGYKKDGGTFQSQTTAQLGTINVPGLAEGLKMMVVGEKRRLWMTEKLAFGGAKGKPAGPLVFDVTLLSITQPPTAPADVAAAPADAETTKSGLASKVVKAGTGTARPSKSSTVTVHYSGWTTDGKLFDSSVLRGAPTTFPLNGVIAGWTEGVQLMVVGETRRLWIPEKLAYKGAEGKPKGMLVFDIELLSIK